MTDGGPHLRAVNDKLDALAAERLAGAQDGITPPQRRGGSGRFLSDVLVELGFCDTERVQAAIEEARRSGVTAENVLLDRREITAEQLSHATAARYGLDHLDLSAF